MVRKHALVSSLAMLLVSGIGGCKGPGEEISLEDDRTGSEGGAEPKVAGDENSAGEHSQSEGSTARGGFGNSGASPSGGSSNAGGHQSPGGNQGTGASPSSGGGGSTHSTGGSEPLQEGGVGNFLQTGGQAQAVGGQAQTGGGQTQTAGGQTQTGGSPAAGGSAPLAGAGSAGEGASNLGGSSGSGSSICLLEPVTGDCEGALERFYFEPSTQTCEPFIYGGCNGNANNFETLAECVATCAPSKQCVVAGTEYMPCCNDGVAMFSSDLAQSEDLVLYPFFGFPEECAEVDCWRDVPSRIATSIDDSTCGFTDECQSVDDCMMLVDSSLCCPCPMAFPKNLPKIDRCWVAPGEPAPLGCAPSACDDACRSCPGHVLGCEEGYPDPYRLCKGVLP